MIPVWFTAIVMVVVVAVIGSLSVTSEDTSPDATASHLRHRRTKRAKAPKHAPAAPTFAPMIAPIATSKPILVPLTPAFPPSFAPVTPPPPPALPPETTSHSKGPRVDAAVSCSCSTRASCPVIGSLSIPGHQKEPLYCNQLHGAENPGVVGHEVWYYQCVELANRWLTEGLRAPRIRGHAKEMCGNADRRAYDVHWKRDGDGYEPVPGDLLVWDGSTYGHVGVVSDVSSRTIVVANQNFGSGGRQTPFVSVPRVDGFFGRPHGSTRLSAKCIIHPKALRGHGTAALGFD
ncbi:MAG: CHAP domain-containing protein [Deltaproteobacteria bacterium]|nr:CHAP domain-containing protein [Deltaproteobacteria bacterium]